MGGTIQAVNASVTKTLAVATASLPSAQQGTPYTTTLQPIGGLPPLVWTLTSGTLDTGLTLASNGVISGTPVNAEVDSLQFTVTDHGGHTAVKTLSMTVNAAAVLTITTSSPLPAATQGSAYSQTLAATGGVPPRTWSLVSATGVNSWAVSSAGVLTGTPVQGETDSLTIRVTDAVAATATVTFSLTVNAVVSGSVPNLSVLPSSVPVDNGDWINFPGAAMQVSSTSGSHPFTDTTGVVLRRLTNGTWPSGTAPGCALVYGSAGPFTSQAFDPAGGNNKNTYHVYFTTVANPSGSGTTSGDYCCDYVLGQGFDQSTLFQLPTGGQGRLTQCFSYLSGEEHILYYLTTGNPGLLTRYDVKARAPAPNAVFSGAGATISSGLNRVGWAQMNWNGNWIAFMSAFDSPATMCAINVTTGQVVTHAVVTAPNEMKFCKGSIPVMVFDYGGGGARFWFINENRLTAQISTTATVTHSNAGESTYYIFDSNDANMSLYAFTTGTVPAADGGVWNGTQSRLYNLGNGGATFDSDYHPNMVWNQTGAGTNEWFCLSVASTTGGGNKTSAAGWSVDSGSVYKTAVNYSAAYGINSNGVTAVNTISGNTYTGMLAKAASRGAMTAGTFFYDKPTNTCYAWMSDSGTPASRTRLFAGDILTQAIGYCKKDGTERRKLCNTYRNDNFFGYDGDCYANWSQDGKVVFFNTNFGIQYNGTSVRVDLMSAEVPLA